MTARALEASRLGRVVLNQRMKAWQHGPFTGRSSVADTLVITRCTVDDALTQTRLIFTRDVGHHTSGWWANPDFERCYHLSLSPRPLETPPDGAVDFSKTVQAAWVQAFFAVNVRLLWVEPPYSAKGKQLEVWHFRLFTDATWRPVLPRGEVYGRELTEAGWRSASEVLELGQAPEVLKQHGLRGVR